MNFADYATAAKFALPRNQGYDAGLRGRTAQDNPYIEGSDEQMAWDFGHYEATGEK